MVETDDNNSSCALSVTRCHDDANDEASFFSAQQSEEEFAQEDDEDEEEEEEEDFDLKPRARRSISSNSRLKDTRNHLEEDDEAAAADDDDDNDQSRSDSDDSDDHSDDPDDDSSDDHGLIEGSPYQDAESSAEVGEPLFEELQALLTPAPPDESAASSSRSRRRNNGMEKPTQQAIEKLGYETAHAMVNARAQIAWSGIVYSPEWLATGHIRGGVKIEGLTPSILLLSLLGDRFFCAETRLLNQIVKELGVKDIVRDFLDEWEWNEEYPKLSSAAALSTQSCRAASSFSYPESVRLDCRKCEIFVARTFECMALLDKQLMDDGDDDDILVSKVQAYLRIMEGNVIILDRATRKVGGDTPSVPYCKSSRSGRSSSVVNGDNDYDRRDSPASFSSENSSVEEFDAETGESPDAKATSMGIRERKSPRTRRTSVEPRKMTTYSYEEPVEKLNPYTGEVLERYPSITEANLSLGFSPSYDGILKVVNGHGRSSGHFFWRPIGSKALPFKRLRPQYLPPEELIRAKKRRRTRQDIPMEQIDLGTGKVIASFPSIDEAASSVGIRHRAILDVLRGIHKASEGYFWRRAGSSAQPRPSVRSLTQTIEKLDPVTGKVLASFPSVPEAAANVGVHRRCIDKAIYGQRKSGGGYSWRRVSATTRQPQPHRRQLPSPKENANVAVEMMDSSSAKVLATFASVGEAAAHIGAKNSSAISNVLHGRQKTCRGYFFRRVGSTQLPYGVEEATWDESSSLSATESAMKSPATRRMNQAGWRTKPVEKIDLSSGKILATFGSVSEAAAHAGVKSAGGISNVLHGREKSCGGYFWRIANSTRLPHGLKAPSDESSSSGMESAMEPLATRRIEKVDRMSGKVLATFGSVNEAAAHTGVKSAGCISKVLRGRQKSSGGFHWRRVGSKRSAHGRLRIPSSLKVPVEMIDKSSGKVLTTFYSVDEGAIHVGKPPSAISNVLQGRTKTCGGYFWRKVGSSRLPHGFEASLDESSSSEAEKEIGPSRKQKKMKHGDGFSKPVEMIDLSSGKVLATFASMTQAAASIDRSVGISYVLHGKQKSCGGYFWREVGSKALPHHLQGDLTDDSRSEESVVGHGSSKPTKRRPLVNKENAEELARLLEKECKQTWRTFKKLRRAVRRSRVKSVEGLPA